MSTSTRSSSTAIIHEGLMKSVLLQWWYLLGIFHDLLSIEVIRAENTLYCYIRRKIVVSLVVVKSKRSERKGAERHTSLGTVVSIVNERWERWSSWKVFASCTYRALYWSIHWAKPFVVLQKALLRSQCILEAIIETQLIVWNVSPMPQVMTVVLWLQKLPHVGVVMHPPHDAPSSPPPSLYPPSLLL